MFLTSPDLELQLVIIALVIAAIISLVIGLFKKNAITGLVWFSIFGNLIFLMNVGASLFRFYNIEWLRSFSVFIWPVINILLIVFFLINKKEKK